MPANAGGDAVAQHVTPSLPAEQVVVNKLDIAKQLSPNGPSDGSIFSQLTSNPFFTAGFGLAGLGAIAAFGQRGVRRAASLIRQRLLVDVEINIKDESYPWFLYWMKEHEKRQSTARAAFGQS